MGAEICAKIPEIEIFPRAHFFSRDEKRKVRFFVPGSDALSVSPQSVEKC